MIKIKVILDDNNKDDKDENKDSEWYFSKF